MNTGKLSKGPWLLKLSKIFKRIRVILMHGILLSPAFNRLQKTNTNSALIAKYLHYLDIQAECINKSSEIIQYVHNSIIDLSEPQSHMSRFVTLDLSLATPTSTVRHQF